MLYQTCEPATFRLNGVDVVDGTFGKARTMDLTAFSTLFDPRSLGIHDQIVQGLFTRNHGVEMELYRLSVYGKGDYFSPYKYTSQEEGVIGSLVVVLPTRHEGGQIVLHENEEKYESEENSTTDSDQAWTIDFADKFAAATKPSICFITFSGDVEHEALPVTSGYRVTLTYNPYHTTPRATSLHSFPTPVHLTLKEALVKLVNDKTKLPNGGYLGFGLQHEYVYSHRELTNSLLDQLKGRDQVLADVCDALDLRYSVKLLYQNIAYEGGFNFLTARKLAGGEGAQNNITDTLMEVLEELTIDLVEGVEILGRPPLALDKLAEEDYNFLAPFYRQPPTQVLEIWPMSSVGVETPFGCLYDNSEDPCLERLYGTACLLVAIDPAESRKPLNV
ncbi:hypothetical protein BDN67DRAFT_982185 [Paxillus ammoniavirescens]|nr:hypothetical protein BDN67DRAFT_982185 [Paxillus ammoniavirescens]